MKSQFANSVFRCLEDRHAYVRPASAKFPVCHTASDSHPHPSLQLPGQAPVTCRNWACVRHKSSQMHSFQLLIVNTKSPPPYPLIPPQASPSHLAPPRDSHSQYTTQRNCTLVLKVTLGPLS